MHEYYRKKHDKLMRELEGFIKLATPFAREKYGDDTEEILNDIRGVYETYLDEFAYIGGDSEPLTRNLLQAAWGGALYEAIKSRDGTPRDAGELMIKAFDAKVSKIPKVLAKLAGRIYTSKTMLKRKARKAAKRMKQPYPEGWVYTMNQGDGKDCKYQVTYTECGIDKFFRKRGIGEITPYLCNLDYAVFGTIGVPLRRTKTIGCGDDCCNFHIQKKGECPAYWPPQFLNDGDLK